MENKSRSVDVTLMTACHFQDASNWIQSQLTSPETFNTDRVLDKSYEYKLT